MLEVSEGKITALGIKDSKGNVVFAYGAKKPEKPAPVCEVCGKPIKAITGKSGKQYTAEQAAEMAKLKYGKVLCGDCV
jgi:ribosomal protein L34E